MSITDLDYLLTSLDFVTQEKPAIYVDVGPSTCPDFRPSTYD